MDDLIYNQKDAPYRYGLRSSAATGCGWVATHNALRILGCHTDTQALIHYYEWQLPIINGNAGTALWGPAVCFKKWGFPVEVHLDHRCFDQAATEADACILFYRWRKGLKLGAHFVALHHTETGFVAYNTFANSTGPDFYGESLEEFLNRHRYFGAVLTTIKKKDRTG